ncbi:protein CHUP1, chloroplastic isoform X3 [Pyrus x bretschneideri]|uniref:protein CHUP1, chloroplastic isoform X3 n=1 Tax=Pyrus x bretschneideri TaxID=225117 RepID=UPI0020305CCE|nr:protein CHUP1, chloroplastic isoform X3 [Pyrus x bretschneideri]XP_048430714.1 protein CHUP1, chloroplastic isoform X3 [Pyrus x bretschneideri]
MSNQTTKSYLRASASSRAKGSPTAARPARAKSVSPDVNSESSSSTRRALQLSNKPKSGELVLGSQKSKELEEIKVVARTRNRQAAEQFSRTRRLRAVESNSKRDALNEDDPHGKNRELQEKLEMSESLIAGLRAEVVALKAELDKTQGFNMELQSQNESLSRNLAAAKAKISASPSPEQRETNGEYQSPKFKDLQKLIANKLERSVVQKDAVNETSPPVKAPPPPPPKSAIPRVSATQCGPPPPPPPPPSLRLRPPPPPPPQSSVRATGGTTQKAPALVEFYHSLRKQEVKRDSPESRNHLKPAATSAHNSIVGEIQNRSAHLLAIKADVQTKGEFINDLIQKVLAAAYTDIEDVLMFVDWLDVELSSLADERAVLKHFKWPERKADAMREAAIEYRDLKLLESEISCYKDDTDIPCAAALKKMAGLLDKSERSIQQLIKLRNSVMRSYQELKIPTDWMLDSGIVSKMVQIKRASMNLANIYMKRVTLELESIRNSDRESSQESLLLQGVHFAYRAHQFAGGLDSETLCAFEEIRQRVPGHLGGSRELLAGIASS